MKERSHSIADIKRRISEDRKRLNKIKKQGFHFSQNIYDDLNSLEKKLIQPPMVHQIWNKKIPISAGIIGILSIILIVNIFSTPIIPNVPPKNPDLPLPIINNIADGMIIKGNYTINGTTSHSNGTISLVQIRINDNPWENAIGTVYWEFPLIITNLSNGNHTLYFQCSDGKSFSNFTRITIYIDKEVKNKPAVTIHNPSNRSILFDRILLNGSATGENSGIQKVEIRFDGGQWKIVNGTTQWYYPWNTIEVENGPHTISVRSFDGMEYSKIKQVSIIVRNPLDCEMPPFSENEKYQIYICELDEPMLPDNNYKMIGKIRKKLDSDDPTFLTELEISKKPDWLIIDLSEKSLTTPPDGKEYIFTISLSITKDAPKNIRMDQALTISATYGNIKFRDNPLIWNLIKRELPIDKFIRTGNW